MRARNCRALRSRAASTSPKPCRATTRASSISACCATNIGRKRKRRPDPMAARVEFFFDLSSPWTCLAFHNLPGVLERTGAAAMYRPILVGGVFNAVNPAVYAARERADNRRIQHSWKVLARKRVVSGKGVSVRVGTGGWRIIKKKKHK